MEAEASEEAGAETGLRLNAGWLGLLVLLTGCQPSAPPTAKVETEASRRFVQAQNGNPANNLPGSLALDTKTGQLCRTYEWGGEASGGTQKTGGATLSELSTDELIKRLSGTTSKIPLCIDLYRTDHNIVQWERGPDGVPRRKDSGSQPDKRKPLSEIFK